MTVTAAPHAAPLVYGLFKPECYQKFFVSHDFFDLACLRLLLSKVLSYGIILGAVLVKFPQIFKIVRSKSTLGLAPSMYVLENIGYLITVVYNGRRGYAFSTYGESVFLLIQGIILVVLFGVFNRRVGLSVTGVAGYAALGYYLWFLAPDSVLPLFQTATIPLFAASRLPQIWRNYASGSTGVLSVITVLLNALGGAARVFTTLSEVDDRVVLAGIVASCALNWILLMQVALYWNSTVAAKVEAPVTASISKTTTAEGAAQKGAGKGKALPTKPKKQE